MAQEAAPEGVGDGKDRATEPEKIELPDDLETKVVELGNPLLKIGDASARVRELQKSLNRDLGGQGGQRVLQSGQPLYVGPAKGPSPDKNRKVRIAYLSRWDKAFYMHGDWEPCDDKGVGSKPDGAGWKKTSHLIS